VWDGQVLLAVLDGANHPVVTLMRGLDLSGTMQGAGGVGGLLAVSLRERGTHFVCYDGNGNVVALVNAADGSESGRYEYGPFGEPVRVTGPVAKANPLRFSTQYADDVTGYVKYLFRDYAPDRGLWLNRDPLEEFGGINLYGISCSDFVNHYDSFGLFGPLAAFAIDCIKEIAGALAIEWLKNRGDQVAACHLIADEVRSGKHIGCQGELVIPSSPFLNNAETKGFAGRIAGCLWSKIKSKGVAVLLKTLPEGVEKDLLQHAIGVGIDRLEDSTQITDATHQIRARCSDNGINVSVFTQITLTLAGKTFHLSTDEKRLGNCNSASLDARSIYDLGCRCCEQSPFTPVPRQ
jgi:RHS repeat-associated protein